MSAMPPNADPPAFRNRAAARSRVPEAGTTRRSFLVLAGKSLLVLSGLLGLGELLQFLGYPSEASPRTQFDLGPASAYPPSSRTPVPQANAILIHGETGFSALSLICPHLGCTVDPVQDGFACPCHGSRFNANGGVRVGPASQPMRVLKVEETDTGELILHTDV
jgi:cytochrome b6-f complex iron-sulfur subunit